MITSSNLSTTCFLPHNIFRQNTWTVGDVSEIISPFAVGPCSISHVTNDNTVVKRNSYSAKLLRRTRLLFTRNLNKNTEGSFINEKHDENTPNKRNALENQLVSEDYIDGRNQSSINETNEKRITGNQPASLINLRKPKDCVRKVEKSGTRKPSRKATRNKKTDRNNFETQLSSSSRGFLKLPSVNKSFETVNKARNTGSKIVNKTQTQQLNHKTTNKQHILQKLLHRNNSHKSGHNKEDAICQSNNLNKSKHILSISPFKKRKIFYSERQSNKVAGIPCVPPCTPEILDQDFVACLADLKSQRNVKDKLVRLENKQIKKERAALKRAKEKEFQRKLEEKEKLMEKQRRQIYALNKVMTELENQEFLKFKEQQTGAPV